METQTAQTPPSVLLERSARHALITLNRPQRRNPLPYRPEDGLRAALHECALDPQVRAVIITGAPPAFCSGMDLAALRLLQSATPDENRRDAEAVLSFFETVRAFPKPLIAAVNGPAVAGGAGLLLLCDRVLLAESASICFSEVRIGFVPALVGTYLRQRAGDGVARDLLLSARTVPAREALAMRLGDECAPDDKLLERATFWAKHYAALSPAGLAATKQLLLESASLLLKDALDKAAHLNAAARSHSEAHEGVAAFLEKRKPKWS